MSKRKRPKRKAARRSTGNPGEHREDADRPASRGQLKWVPTRLLRPYDAVVALFFLAIWLLPIAYVNTWNRSIPFVGRYVHADLGTYLNSQYRTSCLFINSIRSWQNLYYQVRLVGSKAWLTLPEDEYSPMFVFGYRSRIMRMYLQSYRAAPRGDRSGELRRQEIAAFIKTRFEELHPNESRVAEVRFVSVYYAVGGEIARPEGHWQRPPLETIPQGRWSIRSTHSFEQSS